MPKPKVVIEDRDKGYKAIQEEIKKLKDKPYVKIGVLGDTALAAKDVRNEDGTIGKSDNVNLVDVATFHEFGGKSGRPPQRSFIRATVDQNDAKYRSLIGKLHDMIMGIGGRIKTETALGLLGQRIEADIRKRFTSNDWPPLADKGASRIRRNPSSAEPANKKFKGHRPLIDTGQLWRSIQNLVVPKKDY